MMTKTKWLVMSVCAALLFLILCLIGSPRSFLISQYQVPSSDIRFLPHAQTYLMHDYVDPEKAKPNRTQFLNRQGDTPRRYNFNFQEEVPVAGPKAIYIPTMAKDARMLVNGIPFELSKETDLFAPGYGQASFFETLPRFILTPGNNRVDIHYPSDLERSGFRYVFLGPPEKLKSIWEHHQNWMKIMPIGVTALSLLTALFCLVGLVFGRFKRAFAVMGTLAVTLFLQGLSSFLPLSSPALSNSLKLIYPVVILCLLVLWFRIPRRSGIGMAEFVKVFFGVAVVGPVFALLSMIVPYPMPFLFLGTTLTLTSAIPLILFWSFTSVIQDLAERKSIVDVLKTRVSEQELLLDEKSRIVAEEMRKRAVLEERQRFTRDIHDGIGGQLLTLLLRIRSGKVDIHNVAEEIQGGINDLRLVVDSMDHTGDNLEMALSTFKARTARQMDAAGIEFTWSHGEGLDFKLESTRDILNLYRFMQEAVSNAIRHAKARSLEVNISNTETHFTAKILDDGQGADIENLAAGKGLENMRSRARLLGGEVEFGKGLDEQGFGVVLKLPKRPHMD